MPKCPLFGQNAHFLGKMPTFWAKRPFFGQNAHARGKMPTFGQNAHFRVKMSGKMPTTRFPTKCRGAHRFVGTVHPKVALQLDGPSQAGIKNNAIACGYRARLPIAFASCFALLPSDRRGRRSLQFYTTPVPTIHPFIIPSFLHSFIPSFLHSIIHHSALARSPCAGPYNYSCHQSLHHSFIPSFLHSSFRARAGGPCGPLGSLILRA